MGTGRAQHGEHARILPRRPEPARRAPPRVRTPPPAVSPVLFILNGHVASHQAALHPGAGRADQSRYRPFGEMGLAADEPWVRIIGRRSSPGCACGLPGQAQVSGASELTG